MQAKKFNYLIRGMDTTSTGVNHEIQIVEFTVTKRRAQANHVLETQRLGEEKKHGGSLPYAGESRQFRRLGYCSLRHPVSHLIKP